MSLTRVTITGADDAVNPMELRSLSAEFPFVEWGMLMSASRAGTPRYPDRRWLILLENVAADAIRGVGQRMHLSAHFCGEIARQAMSNRLHPFPVIERVQRIQINGYAPGGEGLIAFAKAMPCYEIILQVRDPSDLVPAVADAQAMGERGSVLFDPSGGTGRVIDVYPPLAQVPMGYAGGIGPENVEKVLGQIAHVQRDFWMKDFWIDMESGVRTDDKFDLGKVREVLEKARPFVAGGAS